MSSSTRSPSDAASYANPGVEHGVAARTVEPHERVRERRSAHARRFTVSNCAPAATLRGSRCQHVAGSSRDRRDGGRVVRSVAFVATNRIRRRSVGRRRQTTSSSIVLKPGFARRPRIAAGICSRTSSSTKPVHARRVAMRSTSATHTPPIPWPRGSGDDAEPADPHAIVPKTQQREGGERSVHRVARRAARGRCRCARRDRRTMRRSSSRRRRRRRRACTPATPSAVTGSNGTLSAPRGPCGQPFALVPERGAT